MPELVEAEVCAAQLNVELWHATITHATGAGMWLIGWTVTGVTRVGNAVLFEFDNPGAGTRFMLSRFGATGRWLLAPLADARVSFSLRSPLKDQIELVFIEGRKTGGATLELSTSILDFKYMRYIASTHDPMSDRFDDMWLTSVFARCPAAMSVRDVLVRPEFFPGIGPWIANEALFRAGVAPQRKARDLGPGDIAELTRGVILVVSNGVVKGSAALGAWSNPDGTRGRAADDFCVQGREDEACLVCATPILRNKAHWSASFWCPACQR